MDIKKPYVLFLGDVADQLAAKTADGVADWRPDWCLGQVRLPGCNADCGLPDLSVPEAAAKGGGTLVVGVVNQGGFLPDHWIASVVEAIEAGMDVASGLHSRLASFPAVKAAADKHGAALHDLRHPTRDFGTGKGLKRTGKRALTVGMDCSIGKKYTALAIARELEQRGLKSNFRATGQTGVLIAERGIAIDAIVSDFIAGAAEWLSPDNDADHWDVVEGQGSLFHAAYAGVTLGLMHGSQPDALILCHEPTRTHMRGLPHMPIPNMADVFEPYLTLARLTNPAAKFVGISVNTSQLSAADGDLVMQGIEDQFGLPTVDPIRQGPGRIVDHMLKECGA
jgi:uncharacterized NAD-dependent epimerase/dehydratase family protein